MADIVKQEIYLSQVLAYYTTISIQLHDPNIDLWPSEVKIDTPVGSALGNIDTSFGFYMPFGFPPKNPYGIDGQTDKTHKVAYNLKRPNNNSTLGNDLDKKSLPKNCFSNTICRLDDLPVTQPMTINHITTRFCIAPPTQS